MKLLTKEIINKFKKHPFGSQDGKGKDAEVLVKYFGGSSATWLITEAEEENGEWILYGYCKLFDEFEWGYVSLKELEQVKFPPFGLGVERDLYSNGTVRQLAQD